MEENFVQRELKRYCKIKKKLKIIVIYLLLKKQKNFEDLNDY